LITGSLGYKRDHTDNYGCKIFTMSDKRIFFKLFGEFRSIGANTICITREFGRDYFSG
jgi:hypothetical protein